MRKKKQKTIKFSEWRRLSFCNSRRLPKAVVVNGARKEWVGIGWIDSNRKPTGHEPVVVEG